MSSRLYGAFANLRNALYKRGALKSFALGAPAISVGNITVGGTGKTPFVAYAAEILAARGERVCILTRGYGRENPRRRVIVSNEDEILATAREAGDEPFELARKLLGKAIVVADANRVAAAEWARAQFGATAFVLDDAFQHRRARRDLDIVLLDASNPFGNGKTLPFGILREPLENLTRADLIVITRADLVDDEKLFELKSAISKLNSGCPIITAKNKITKLTALEKFHEETAVSVQPENSTDENRKSQIPNPKSQIPNALAFCALGNPDNFFEQLRRENFKLLACRAFPDHHRYTPKDADALNALAKESGAEMLLTTGKDAVKLKDLKFELPCFVVENELRFDDEKKLRSTIDAVFK